MKKLFFFFSILITCFSVYSQTSYNAKSIYFAGTTGTSIKDTATFCQSNPCPIGTLIMGAQHSDTTLYIRTRTGWSAIQHGAPTTVTASNGLTKSVNDIQLGGTLTKNTSIAQGGFNTSFSGIGTVNFSPSATKAGMNWGQVAGNPLTLNNADTWYDLTLNKFKGYQNGSVVNMINQSSGGPQLVQLSDGLGGFTSDSHLFFNNSLQVTNGNGFASTDGGSNVILIQPTIATLNNPYTISGGTLTLNPTGSALGFLFDNTSVSNTVPTLKAVGSSSNVGLSFKAKADGNIYLTNDAPVSGIMNVGIGDPSNSTLTQANILPYGTGSNINLSIGSIGTGVNQFGGDPTTGTGISMSSNTQLLASSRTQPMNLRSGVGGAGPNTGTTLLLNNTTPIATFQDLVTTPTSSISILPKSAGIASTKLTSGAPSGFTISSANGISGAVTGQTFNLQAGNGFSSGNNAGGNITLTGGTGNGSGAGGSVSIDGGTSGSGTKGAITIGNGGTTSAVTINAGSGNTINIGTGSENINIGNTGDLTLTAGTTFDVATGGSAEITLVTNDITFFSGSNNISYHKTGSTDGVIPISYTTTSTLDFPNTTTGVSDLTIALTGVAVGDACYVGAPNGSVTATASYWCWVSSTNNVTVRFAPKAVTGEDPASGTFKIVVSH